MNILKKGDYVLINPYFWTTHIEVVGVISELEEECGRENYYIVVIRRPGIESPIPLSIPGRHLRKVTPESDPELFI